jgi:hypothetical protein
MVFVNYAVVLGVIVINVQIINVFNVLVSFILITSNVINALICRVVVQECVDYMAVNNAYLGILNVAQFVCCVKV